jgi:tripartite-type tricarboxylate transporter receptor subunit TctC
VLAVKSAPADGYSILLASSSMLSVNPIVIKDLPYDPVKDLKPLTGLGRYVSVLVVHPDSKLKTIADLVAAAKKDPSKPMNAGTYSAAYYLPLEWFAGLAGVKFTNVSYKGPPQMATDVMGNQLDFGYMSLSDAAPLLTSGRLRSLGTSGARRHADFPNMPTIAESGYPDYVTFVWNAIYVRAETPADITNKLADAFKQVLASNAFKDYAKKIQLELMPLEPAAMQKFHVEELERFRGIAKTVGFKPE